MLEKIKALKMNFVVSSLFSIAVGAVLLIWPAMSIRVVCRLLGGVLLLMAVMHLVSYLGAQRGTLQKSTELAVTVILAAVGALIFLNPAFVVSIIPFIIGVIMVVHGIYDLQQVFYMIRTKYSGWWVGMLFALLTVAGGVYLCAHSFGMVSAAVRIIGALLVFDGVSDGWILASTGTITRRIRRAAEDQIKDENVID